MRTFQLKRKRNFLGIFSIVLLTISVLVVSFYILDNSGGISGNAVANGNPTGYGTPSSISNQASGFFSGVANFFSSTFISIGNFFSSTYSTVKSVDWNSVSDIAIIIIDLLSFCFLCKMIVKFSPSFSEKVFFKVSSSYFFILFLVAPIMIASYFFALKFAAYQNYVGVLVLPIFLVSGFFTKLFAMFGWLLLSFVIYAIVKFVRLTSKRVKVSQRREKVRSAKEGLEILSSVGNDNS